MWCDWILEETIPEVENNSEDILIISGDMTIKRQREVYRHEVKQIRFGVKLDMEDKDIEL